MLFCSQRSWLRHCHCGRKWCRDERKTISLVRLFGALCKICCRKDLQPSKPKNNNCHHNGHSSCYATESTRANTIRATAATTMTTKCDTRGPSYEASGVFLRRDARVCRFCVLTTYILRLLLLLTSTTGRFVSRVIPYPSSNALNARSACKQRARSAGESLLQLLRAFISMTLLPEE